MAYADYTFYQHEYGGNSIDDVTFERLTKRAHLYVEGITGKISAPIPDAAKMAVCAVIEVMLENEQGGEVASQSVGSWSKTFAKTAKTNQQRLRDAAVQYLQPAGLIPRWL